MNGSGREKEEKPVRVHTGEDRGLIPRLAGSVGVGHFVNSWCVMMSQGGVYCIFLIANNVEHLVTHLPSVIFFGKMSIHVFCPFILMGFICFYCWVLRVLYIL